MQTVNQLVLFREDPKRLSSALNWNAFWAMAYGAASFATFFTMFLVKLTTHFFQSADSILVKFAEEFVEIGEPSGPVPLLGMDGAGVLFASMILMGGFVGMTAQRSAIVVYKNILMDQGVDFDQGDDRRGKMVLLGLPAGIFAGGIFALLTLASD